MVVQADRLTQIDEKIRRAVEMVEADSGASPVLGAVAQELQRKSQKAMGALQGADDGEIRDAIIETEQAADSAKFAAEADQGAKEETREAVVAAHLSICILKGKL